VVKLTEELLAQIVQRHGFAELEWTQSIPIPGDPEFPVLQLPADRLRYATDRGYPVKFALGRIAKHAPLLFVQVESFDVARRKTEGADWAIPAAYTPQTEDERIHQVLGFDEGWEDAEHECLFVCDQRFAIFWRAVVIRERFGLTVPEIRSLYPVALDAEQIATLRDALAKWPSA
jgi:hypothetical protein